MKIQTSQEPLPLHSSSFHLSAPLVDPSDMRSRPLPPPPGLWVDPMAAQVPASSSPSRVTGSLPPPPHISSYRSFTSSSSSTFTPATFTPATSSASTQATSSSFSLSGFPPPPPPPPSATTFSSPTRSQTPSLGAAKARSALRFFAISKATRNATAWFAEHAARKDAADAKFEDERHTAVESEAAAIATKIRTEEDSRKAVIQAKANEAVKSSIQSLLSRGLHNECDIILNRCHQICTDGGLDLSVVLQEPLIDGKPPVYWAILNGSTTSGEALHALVISLLDVCHPLKETTIASIRLACMLTSNNVLLQHLFWHFPALSPLTRSDAMVLSSVGGGDVVTVDETQDGIGTFVARIQIRRFRLRMRVSKLVKIEFVTSGRPA
jgi:hypothetical protein